MLNPSANLTYRTPVGYPCDVVRGDLSMNSCAMAPWLMIRTAWTPALVMRESWTAWMSSSTATTRFVSEKECRACCPAPFVQACDRKDHGKEEGDAVGKGVLPNGLK